MKITINEAAFLKEELPLEKAFILLAVKENCNFMRVVDKMLEESMIIKEPITEKYYVTQRWDDVLCKTLLDKDSEIPDEKICSEIAEELRQLFPQGKKDGTNIYWRGNNREITLKLQKFFKLYGNYDKEQVLQATRKYIESFNGNYDTMRVAKYFILKNDIKQGEISELATWLEHIDDEEFDGNWNTELK